MQLKRGAISRATAPLSCRGSGHLRVDNSPYTMRGKGDLPAGWIWRDFDERFQGNRSGMNLMKFADS